MRLGVMNDDALLTTGHRPPFHPGAACRYPGPVMRGLTPCIVAH